MADTVKVAPQKVKRCPECGTGFGAEAAFCPFDGAALKTGTWDPSRDPLTGAVIDHRYQVIEPLGEGGMGTVYKVRHTTLDRHFAMKVLRRDLASDHSLAERFLHEAKATAAIRHPGVVAISDFGELADGAPYFVMDLLIGETLATRMRARGLLDPREAASIARKLADALSAAHAAGVVHRDLKPENVFLVGTAVGRASSDELRIVDFGAAKIIGKSKMTRPGVVFGTPYYMSPEQAAGHQVDARADVYSLGVLLFEMLTGVLPFEADTYMGVLTKHMFEAPVKPSERMPAGTALGDLDAVVLRALEKEPSSRYASMGEMSAALGRAFANVPTATMPYAAPRSVPVAFATLSTADKIQRSVSRHVVEESRRKRRTVVVAVITAAATLALCALAVSLMDDAKRKPQTSTTTLAPAASSASPSLTAASSLVPELAPASPPELAPASAAPAELASASASAAPPPASPPSPSPPAEPTTSQRPSSPRPAHFAAPVTKPPDDLPDPWKH